MQAAVYSDVCNFALPHPDDTPLAWLPVLPDM